MLETAVAQLRFAASLLAGRPFSPWSLEQLIKSLRATAHEFGTIGAGGAEIVSGPAMNAETRRELQLRRLRAQAVKAKDTAYYSQLFAALDLDPASIKQHADIARIPITGKENVRDQPGAFVRRGSRPYLCATTTGTTGQPTTISFSSRELPRLLCLAGHSPPAEPRHPGGRYRADQHERPRRAGQPVPGRGLRPRRRHGDAGRLARPGRDAGTPGGPAVAAGPVSAGERPLYLSFLPG